MSLLGLLGLIFGIIAVVKGAAPLARLRSRKAGVLAIVLSLVLLMFGSGANAAVQQSGSNMASLTAQSSAGTTSTPQASPSATPKATTKPSTKATTKPTVKPRPTKPKSTSTPTPVATEAEVQEASVLPYAVVTVDDAGIDVGTSAVTVSGGNGEKVTTYLVQYIDGVEVSRSVSRE